MANRNVSQLPENTDPQDTDWILGASGNSPSVLQKIAVGNVKPNIPTQLSGFENDSNFITAEDIPSKLSEFENDSNFITAEDIPSSSGGSIKFSLPVNENKVLDSSGYYFTDAIATDITIDCSNLEIGDHIIWQNLSTKSVFFSGLNSIDSVSIPLNKGVKILSTNFIQFFLKDENKNIKKLQGNHLIDWLPGQNTGFSFWRVDFNNMLTEIGFYYSDFPDVLVRPFGSEIIEISSIPTNPANNVLPNDGNYESGVYGTYQQETQVRYILPFPRVITALKIGLLPNYPYFPNNIKLYYGESLTNWNLAKEWVNPSIPGVLNVE